MTPFSPEMLQWLIIPLAAGLDAAMGDPYALPHPVRWMGRGIEICEPFFRSCIRNHYLAGALFAVSLIVGSWAVTTGVLLWAHAIHPVLGHGLTTVLIFFSISTRSLVKAAAQIEHSLTNGLVEKARSQVAMVVGRDVTHYGADDIARATVETVAENFVDGVLSPLFFAVLGGAPMAMAYKMVNTLDSMVGYKNRRYHRFGWAAARIDDAANFFPARLSVIVIAIAARPLGRQRCLRAMMTALQEGSHHHSPNAGYPEAAFAGALEVKLNGPDAYDGIQVEKPFIGIAFGPVQVHHIQEARTLLVLAAMVSFIVAWAAFILRF